MWTWLSLYVTPAKLVSWLMHKLLFAFCSCKLENGRLCHFIARSTLYDLKALVSHYWMIALHDSVFLFPLFWRKKTLGIKQPIKSVCLSLFPICTLCIYFGSSYVYGGTCYGRFCWVFLSCLFAVRRNAAATEVGVTIGIEAEVKLCTIAKAFYCKSLVMRNYHEKGWSGWGTGSFCTLVLTMKLKIIAEKELCWATGRCRWLIVWVVVAVWKGGQRKAARDGRRMCIKS